MGEVTYVSRVRVEPVEGKMRRAYLPIQEEPVLFGVHSEVAEHYGVSPEEEESHDTTLDYLVAAARWQRVEFPSITSTATRWGR